MPIIETEIWKPNPERPGTIIFDRQRKAQDIFNELEAHLKADGRLPDEYFLFDARGNWQNGALFPKDADILCSANYGGSEGIYLDIFVRCEKDVYEHSRDNGVLGWHKRMVNVPFATGKTLGESIDDLDKMNLAASSVIAAFYGREVEVRERYTNIARGKEKRIFSQPHDRNAVGSKAQTIYGEVQPGDWVISTGNNDYSYLIGTVTAIDKLGTPEHGTDNTTDDVHVDFTAFDYPPERITEIEEDFSDLYGEPKTFDELSLDDVIMAPKMLIRITHLEHDEITRMGNLRANCEAFCNCFPGAVVPESEKHAALLERLETNLVDYHDSLMGLGARELIEIADKIAAMSDVYSYLCFHDYSDNELDYLLKFQCPLEVVADEWHRRTEDLSDMSFALDEVFDKRDALQGDYALMPDPPVPAAGTIKTPQKTESVDAKPRTLSEKLKAAGEKVKAQDKHNNEKSHNREER